MDAFSQLMDGFAVALTLMNLMWCLVGTTLGTAIGVLPGLGPALTIALLLPITFKVDADRGVHPVRRHLLRRHVRRLDHLDPAQHAGRERHHRHRARGQQDGPQRPRRRGARDLGHRLVRGRHRRHARHHVPGAHRRRPRAAVRPRRLFLADGVRLRHRLGGARLLGGARADRAVPRHLARPDRHRPADRAGALHLRPAGAARRHQRDRGRGRAVRGRRDALRRLALPLRQGRDHPAAGLDLDDARRVEALVEAVAARHGASAFRSARCRRAAPRSRPS